MTTLASGKSVSFFTLLVLISFASVNAVLCTPALPAISSYFKFSSAVTGWLVTGYLLGYAVGQLIYAPFINRFGRKKALYAGILLQIISSLACVLSAYSHSGTCMLIGRILQALGGGIGLSSTFAIVHEEYSGREASSKMAYLLMSFAITPNLAVMVGGILTTYFNWTVCFYLSALYGMLVLVLLTQLPESTQSLDKDALKIRPLMQRYLQSIKDKNIMRGGLLMGLCSASFYSFSALVPFIAMHQFKMDAQTFGFANLLPSIGLLLGSIIGGRLARFYNPLSLLYFGCSITAGGVLLVLVSGLLHHNQWLLFFIACSVMYLGMSFLMGNTSGIALKNAANKAQASSVLSFTNLGFATTIVMASGFFPATVATISMLYVGLLGLMTVLIRQVDRNSVKNVYQKVFM